MTDLQLHPDSTSTTVAAGPAATSTGLFVPSPPANRRQRIVWGARDAWTVVRRNLAHLWLQPGELIGELVFPALMVLLFGYVLGSAISVPGGGDYKLYLMPGLFAMTAISGGIATMMSVAMDKGRGVMDRFRSMPMARSAVLLGQTGADILVGVVAMTVMVGFGFVVGWHPTNGFASAVLGFALLITFRYAVSWGGTVLGLTLREETADKLIPLVFPITMLSNGFVPTANMPTWLRTIADWNPVSALVSSCRELFMGPGAANPAGGHLALPLQHPVVTTVVWIAVMLTLFVTISVRKFRSASA